jgi:stage V sporulation protein AD
MKGEVDAMIVGKQSILFEENVYIEETACVAGQKESEGPLGKLFDVVVEDAMAGMENWEEAESTLQQLAVDKLLEKWDGKKEDLRYIFAATSFGLMQYEIPMFGLYGACSTFGEALSLAAMTVHAGYAGHVIALASSHFASAEKQFRYPLEYGNQRPPASTWTVTGCGAAVIGTEKGEVCIRGITTGKVIDFGVKDSMNMGACMAPAAADVIAANLEDMQKDVTYYDCIITGDLGAVGKTILMDLLKEKGYDLTGRYTDCGLEIFDAESQDTKAGGSGCGCSAVTMCSYIMKKMKNHSWNRVLFVPTGALLSTVSYNEGKSVPGIAHAVILERKGNRK